MLTTFTVNTVADTVDANVGDGIAADASGNASLLAAIMEANANGTSDTIELPAGTFVLSLSGSGENAAATGDLDITNDVSGADLTIRGVGAGASIISGSGFGSGNEDRIFEVHPVPRQPSIQSPFGTAAHYLSRQTVVASSTREH